MVPGDRGSSVGGARTTRRGLVAALVGAAGVGLAGCGRVTNYEFRAEAVELPESDREVTGYSERSRTSWTTERNRTVSGVEVEASIESNVTVYEARGATPPVIAVLSTPRAAVSGQVMNPLARRSPEELLTSAAAEPFLAAAGLDDVGRGTDANWERGPSSVGSRDGRFLGESATVESYAGLRNGDARSVAFAHLARAESNDVAIAGAVYGRAVEEVREPYVGAGGYRSRGAFDDAVESFAETIERMEFAD